MNLRHFLDPSGRLPAKTWRAAGFGLLVWLALVAALVAKLCSQGLIPASALSLACVLFPTIFLIPYAPELPEKQWTRLERSDRVSMAALVCAFVVGAGFAIYGIEVASFKAGFLALPGIGLALIISRTRLLSLAASEMAT